jgi:hypothetical protein
MPITILLLLATPLAFMFSWLVLGIAMSAAVRRRAYCRSSEGGPVKAAAGRIAILYLTCDDFNETACLSLLAQEGVTCDVFILDDSTNASQRRRIDSWVQGRGRNVVLVRRSQRIGYKAGNVNNWLAGQDDRATVYPYMLLVDSDGCLPSDFASRLLRCLESNDYVFAQGCHRSTTDLRTPFQKFLHPEIEYRCLHAVPARNFFNVPPMLGHGVLLRTQSLVEVGGFPYVVSEDLALTILFADKGWVGVIVSDVIASESFPASYYSYCKRKRRYIQADAEIVRKMLGRLWRTPIPFLARLDLTIRELRFPITATQWVLLSAVAVAAVFGRGTNVTLPPVAWTSILLLLLPAFPFLAMRRLSLAQRLSYAFIEAFVGASMAALYPIPLVRGLIGQQHFDPTGNVVAKQAGSVSEIIFETASSVLFIAAGAVSGNLVLVAIGFAVGCGWLLRSRWESVTLIGGATVFWLLLVSQVYLDVRNGAVPVEHLVILIGLLQHPL